MNSTAYRKPSMPHPCDPAYHAMLAGLGLKEDGPFIAKINDGPGESGLSITPATPTALNDDALLTELKKLHPDGF